VIFLSLERRSRYGKHAKINCPLVPLEASLNLSIKKKPQPSWLSDTLMEQIQPFKLFRADHNMILRDAGKRDDHCTIEVSFRKAES